MREAQGGFGLGHLVAGCIIAAVIAGAMGLMDFKDPCAEMGRRGVGAASLPAHCTIPGSGTSRLRPNPLMTQ